MDEIVSQKPPIIETPPLISTPEIIPENIIKKKLSIWVWIIPILFIILIYIIFKQQQQLLNANKKGISENVIPTTVPMAEPTQIPTNNETAIIGLSTSLSSYQSISSGSSGNVPAGTGTTEATSITPLNVLANPNSDGKSSTITWKTKSPAQGVIEYGTSPGSLILKSIEAETTTNHSVTIQTHKSMLYYYRIRVGQAFFDNGGIPYSLSTD